MLGDQEIKMRIKILNKDDIRETVPIHVEIYDAKSKPKVTVEGLGTVDIKKIENGYLAEFWTAQKGEYKIAVTDSDSRWSGDVIVKEQSYLSFQSEFLFFLISLMICLLGIFVWMKKREKV